MARALSDFAFTSPSSSVGPFPSNFVPPITTTNSTTYSMSSVSSTPVSSSSVTFNAPTGAYFLSRGLQNNGQLNRSHGSSLPLSSSSFQSSSSAASSFDMSPDLGGISLGGKEEMGKTDGKHHHQLPKNRYQNSRSGFARVLLTCEFVFATAHPF